MVGLKDVAKACNVSIATVSKALSNSADISEERKKQVWEKVHELGYFPNTAARTLKTKRSYNIGVIFTDEQNRGITHPYFTYVLESLKETIEAHGYDMTFINRSCNGEMKMSYYDRCKYRGVDGVVIACVDFEDPEIRELVTKDIPIVTIDYMYPHTAAVMSDNAACMQKLLQEIIDRGHRRIAYIHGRQSFVSNERLTAYKETLQANQIELIEGYLLESPYQDIAVACEHTKKLLARTDPPTCILYPDDYTCIGGVNAGRQLGKRIPDDFSIVGYDGIQMGALLEPQLTTVDQRSDQVGAAAGEKIIQLIEKPTEHLGLIQVIEGDVCVRESLKSLLE